MPDSMHMDGYRAAAHDHAITASQAAGDARDRNDAARAAERAPRMGTGLHHCNPIDPACTVCAYVERQRWLAQVEREAERGGDDYHRDADA